MGQIAAITRSAPAGTASASSDKLERRLASLGPKRETYVVVDSYQDAGLSWYQNDGTPADGGWIERLIWPGIPTVQSKAYQAVRQSCRRLMPMAN